MERVVFSSGLMARPDVSRRRSTLADPADRDNKEPQRPVQILSRSD